MEQKWERVGTIGVDAGLCWIGDPCYVLHADEPPKDIGKNWHEFCDRVNSEDRTKMVPCHQCKGNTITWDEFVTQLSTVAEGAETLAELKSKFCRACDGKGVYPAHVDNWQFNYDLGHAGLGVCVSTGWGDGTYGVYVRRSEENRIAEVRVVFMDSELEPEDE